MAITAAAESDLVVVRFRDSGPGVAHPEELFPITSVEQARMSYYILQFQHPGVAEQWLRADNWKNFREAWAGGDTDAQIADLSEPGKLEARIYWYRANATSAVSTRFCDLRLHDYTDYTASHSFDSSCVVPRHPLTSSDMAPAAGFAPH
jgi:hypothetical protein